MALRHIHYLKMHGFNIIIKPVRREHFTDEDSSLLQIPHMNNSTNCIKCHLVSLCCQMSEQQWTLNGCTFCLLEKVQNTVALMFHENHRSFQNCLIRRTFKDCRLVNRHRKVDVQIHICIWDTFLPVYSVFEDFNACLKSTLLHWLTL